MDNSSSPNLTLFTGNEKYTAGLIILLGSLINFFTNIRKFKYDKISSYGLLLLLALMAEFLAHI